MEQQGELFPNPSSTIIVDSTRGEPRVWIRRLVIWAKPEEMIQDVPLRRGLNIIYSPDPGTKSSALGQAGGSGHGVGKTLFCRLLRYCLGEDTFAHDDLRRSIQKTFPEGLVGAEVMVNGRLWSVIRPIGNTRKHIARPGVDLGELLSGSAEDTDISVFFTTLNNLIPGTIDNNIPGDQEWKRWLFALAWLSRDQESRFSGLLDWRHSESNTRSPVRDTSSDERTVIIRSFLNIMADQERKVQKERDDLSAQKLSLTQNAAYYSRNINGLHEEIIQALGQAPGTDTDALSAKSLLEIAKNKLQSTNEDVVDTTIIAALEKKREELEGLVSQQALARKKAEDVQGLIDLQTEQIRALKGERANLDAAAIKAKLGPICPVCSVPIEEALAKGCGLSNALPDEKKIEDEKTNKQNQIVISEQAIITYKNSQTQYNTAIQNLDRQINEVRRQIQNLESRIVDEQKAQRQKWYATKSIEEKATRLVNYQENKDKTDAELKNLPDREAEFREKLQKLRSQHSQILTRLGELFTYICSAFLGSGDTRLELTGKGIQASVKVGGTAMETLKVVAFDIAAMLMSVEGKTVLPAFLLHDSPREGDLGISIYHRFFHLPIELEKLGDEPLFQYIVTTTSPPPEEFSNTKYIVLKLDGTDASKRLLKINL